MNGLAERFLSFFVDNFPPWQAIAIGGPVGIAWSYACLRFSGHLKTRRRWQTGYTRKTFHFLIFGSVVAIERVWGTPIVCLFGGACSLVIFYAVWRGPGHPLYEAMAREKDHPHRSYYILVPYVATLVGGLTSNILFGPAAVVGYLVTGLGDAVGEPVGTALGKHPYRVPSLGSVKAVRSWEGSAAVLVASAAAIAAAVAISPELHFTPWSVLTIPLVAVVCAAVEALSPHGWDNATLQLIPSLLAWVAVR